MKNPMGQVHVRTTLAQKSAPHLSIMGVLLATCFLLAGGVVVPRAEIPIANTSGFPVESPFVGVADRLLPSVVFIETTSELDLSLLGQLPEDSNHSGIQEMSSSGSGVIVSTDGHILTNHHVVEDADEILVFLDDGESLNATVIGLDAESDLAVIKVDRKFSSNRVAPFGDSDKIRIGDWAIALGNPYGLQQSLTVGVISAKGRNELNIYGGAPIFQDFIQTDASINFGNSGGPLANIRGEVIGINTAINSMGQGIGFAIPMNMARRVYEQILRDGRVHRGYLGMAPGPLGDEELERLGLPASTKGVVVLSVVEDTPAGRGDLRASDVITSWNGHPIRNVQDFRLRVAAEEPGQQVRASILRNGESHELNFVLEDRADYLSQARARVIPDSPEEIIGELILGLGIQNITPEGLEAHGLSTDDVDINGGVIVVSVPEGSWLRGQLHVGDLITKVDRFRIRNMTDLKRVEQEIRNRVGSTLFHIVRGSRSTIVPVLP